MPPTDHPGEHDEDDHPVDATEHLLTFVRDRDTPCPACGYNIRNLRKPVCPECQQSLHLTVGMEQPNVGLLIATVAPCIFSGMAAILLAIPLTMVALTGGPPQPTSIILTDIIGFLSGITGIVLFIKRRTFLKQRADVQQGWAVTMWFIHFAAFGLLVYYVVYHA